MKSLIRALELDCYKAFGGGRGKQEYINKNGDPNVPQRLLWPNISKYVTSYFYHAVFTVSHFLKHKIRFIKPQGHKTWFSMFRTLFQPEKQTSDLQGWRSVKYLDENLAPILGLLEENEYIPFWFELWKQFNTLQILPNAYPNEKFLTKKASETDVPKVTKMHLLQRAQWSNNIGPDLHSEDENEKAKPIRLQGADQARQIDPTNLQENFEDQDLEMLEMDIDDELPEELEDALDIEEEVIKTGTTDPKIYGKKRTRSITKGIKRERKRGRKKNKKDSDQEED